MILAGDIGGTKTLLGLFDAAAPRPVASLLRSFATLEYTDLPSIISAFLDAAGVGARSVSAASFGVAGPVLGDKATLTNVPWSVDAGVVAKRFGFGHVALLNDLEAMAYSVPVLGSSELHELQKGQRNPSGNIAVIAAGTGLGEALLHNVDGRYLPSATEGGHGDFAARTDREIELLRALRPQFGRVDVERVVSGRGLLNLHRFTHARPCDAHIDLDHPDAAASISAAALARTCACCVETLDLFVDAYGAETGNLALRSVATGGVFVGGGIAPKILPAMTAGAFMRAFRAKAPLEGMLEAMPVHVILNAEAGLLGAAVFAADTEG